MTFYSQLGKAFMMGKPIEIINGDMGIINDIGLMQVMRWV